MLGATRGAAYRPDMATPSLELFLFDLAGTTLRDDGLVARAFLAAARGAGRSVGEEWLREQMGRHKQEVFRALLGEEPPTPERLASLTEAFESALEQELEELGAEPLPGAREALALLPRHGIAVGFTTGFSAHTADVVLRALEFPRDLCVSSDQVARGRPAPDLIQEAMRRAGLCEATRVGVAGDTPRDLEAGSAAGCGVVVGVPTGSHTLEDLEAHPHTSLIEDLRALPALLGLA